MTYTCTDESGRTVSVEAYWPPGAARKAFDLFNFDDGVIREERIIDVDGETFHVTTQTVRLYDR